MRKLIAAATAVLTLGAAGLPSLALADDSSSSSSSSSSLSAKAQYKAEVQLLRQKYKAEGSAKVETARKNVDTACMQTAVEKRDNAVIVAVKTFNDSWVKALETRRDELKAAWAMTDPAARKTAVRNAWKKYRESRKMSRETFKSARKNAWSTFKADAKACKAVTTGDEGMDNDDNP